jgi:hypothetical protein
MKIDPELQSQVDAQLLEQGSFAVLDFLMDSGRLLPDDYERWRRGEVGSLDEVLMGSMDKIRSQVETMAHYARKIGLVEEQQTFHPWRADASPGAPPLTISADAALRALIGARFAPAQDLPQLDLFFDNPVVALTSGIVRALSAGDLEEGQRLLDRLYDQAPNHADLPAYDRLLAALSHKTDPIDDPRRELSLLLQISTTAKRLMASQARDLLTPLWRHHAQALRGHAFRAEEPDLHRSFSLCQAQDWEDGAQAVRDEPQWWLAAPLCLRLAQSCFYRRDRIGGLTAWFHLCWHAPEEAADVLDHRRHPDIGTTALWHRFVDVMEDPDGTGSADALGPDDFPAWLLWQEPGLTRELPADLSAGETSGERSYRLVHGWIGARRANLQGEEMSLRKALQAANPVLFRCLKRSVTGS